jgi:hypothetical protein
MSGCEEELVRGTFRRLDKFKPSMRKKLIKESTKNILSTIED